MSILKDIAKEYNAFKHTCAIEWQVRCNEYVEINKRLRKQEIERGVTTHSQATPIPIDDSFEAFLKTKLKDEL